MSIWEWIASGKGEMALAGIAGSAVSVAMEWSGFMAGIRRLFVGAVTAYFLAPVGLPLFKWVLDRLMSRLNNQPASAVSSLVSVG